MPANHQVGNPLSGKRLRVTVRFAFTIDPLSSYYFLINNASDANAPGPVPVIDIPYGNGFATGTGGQPGFTDFVVFNNEQPQGYGVRHVVGVPEERNFTIPVRPVTFTPPHLLVTTRGRLTNCNSRLISLS